jgi:hypothetical protein
LSTSGSTAWAYDPDLPVPGLDRSGAIGMNGWYISPVSVSATGADAISGIAGASIFVDGGSEQSSVTLNEGIHQVVAGVIDNAGNTASSSSFIIAVDITTPVIDVSAAGAPGANGWYVSEVQVSATAMDSTSGIDSLEVYVDGAWQAFAAPISLMDGQHVVRFRATDNAGNVTTTTPQQYLIDTAAPVITATVTGTNGTNGWYVSNLQIAASTSDAGSDLDTFEQSVDGGIWQTYSAPLSFTTGQHTVQFRAVDQAGNLSQITQNALIDSIGPVIELPVRWTLGKVASYSVADQESGLASVRVVIEDENEKYPKVAWNEDASGTSFESEINWNGKFKDGTTAPAGTYLVWVKASDAAGNESVKLGKVNVPASIFSWFLPAPPTWTALPTATPRPTATLQPALGAVEAPAPQAPVPVTSLTKPTIVVSSFSAGGVVNEYATQAPKPINSSLPLVSAAIASMAAAAAYAATQKEQEEEGTQRKKNKKSDKPSRMSYRQIAKAYAAAQEEKKRKAKLEDEVQQAQQRGAQIDMTEAERFEAYKQTERYQSYQASLRAWEQKKANEARAAQADMSEAEKLAAYQQTDRYTSYQAELHAWEVQKSKETVEALSSQDPTFDGLVKHAEYEFVDGKAFVQGVGDSMDIHPNDIEQSYYLGDCYLLAPLAEIALQDPQVIRDMIKPVAPGEYSVTFYKKEKSGEFTPVTEPVTINLPEDQNGNLVFVHGADSLPPELWPMLIEKGFAQLNGNYNNIAKGGWSDKAMETLTGVPSQIYKPRDLSVYQLHYELFVGHAVTASTVSDLRFFDGKLNIPNQPDRDPLFTSGTLHPDHEYYVVNANPQAGTVTLRNPWGWDWNETVLTFDEFQRAFQQVSVNPLH